MIITMMSFIYDAPSSTPGTKMATVTQMMIPAGVLDNFDSKMAGLAKELHFNVPRCILGFYYDQKRLEAIPPEFVFPAGGPPVKLDSPYIIMFVHNRSTLERDLLKVEQEFQLPQMLLGETLGNIAREIGLSLVIENWQSDDFDLISTIQTTLENQRCHQSALDALERVSKDFKVFSEAHSFVGSCIPIFTGEDRSQPAESYLIGIEHAGICLINERPPPTEFCQKPVVYYESKLLSTSGKVDPGQQLRMSQYLADDDVFTLGLPFSFRDKFYGLTVAHPFLPGKVKDGDDELQICGSSERGDIIGTSARLRSLPSVDSSLVDVHCFPLTISPADAVPLENVIQSFKGVFLHPGAMVSRLGGRFSFGGPRKVRWCSPSLVDPKFPGDLICFHEMPKPASSSAIAEKTFLFAVDGDSHNRPFLTVGDSGTVIHITEDENPSPVFLGIQAVLSQNWTRSYHLAPGPFVAQFLRAKFIETTI